ncbi:hypothetical protein IMZ31_18910 (plasmid) [Pontibacillus sp. ALD_SL1]|uniref:hypothetical protein n=1 Tax=Pontibacillus sp. ALD_SL1 TaxID=2777185 RepID=UPI001A95AE52|nr:hypothetical protein [Pontibacillus sp. ALD_SL1]QST02620.1 hypothetical protein IMZ31_18910 [Pontibacillus sp. ALD_SL1]
MSSVSRDMIEGYESLARMIQHFVWEGKPHKSERKEHTLEEYDDLLESIRLQCWDNYNEGAYDKGWTTKKDEESQYK